MGFGKKLLVGLAMTIGVLAVGCAPQNPSPGPSPAPGTPAPQTSPSPAGTASPADIQATLNRISQLDQRLKQLSANNPSPNDLVNTMQDILTVMDFITAEYPQMSAQQRTQALNGMTAVLGDEIAVFNTHAPIYRATATAFALAHPTPTPVPSTPSPQASPAPTAPGTAATVAGTGTPAAAVAGTPTPASTAAATPAPAVTRGPSPSPTGASAASQILADLEAIRNETTSLANDQPTDQDIVRLLGRLQADLSQLSQQSASMSDSEVVSVLKSFDQTVAFLISVVQTHTQQELGAIATPTPIPTSTPPTTTTPPTTSTPGP